MSKKTDMLGATLKRVISKVIQSDLKDPRLGFLTITKIKVSRDSRYAIVYVSVLEEEETPGQSVKILNKSLGFIKHSIKPMLRVRFMPEIKFVYDNTEENAEKIEKLIEEIRND